MLSENTQKVWIASPKAAEFFDLARRYLDAAELQNDRIWAHALPVEDGDPQLAKTAFEEIVIEVHLYFVVLNDVYRFLEQITAEEIFQELHPRLAGLNESWFKHYNKGRNLFEHLEERLRRPHRGTRITFGLRMGSGKFLHSDDEWDISKSAFDSLKVDVEHFMDSIVAASESNGTS